MSPSSLEPAFYSISTASRLRSAKRIHYNEDAWSQHSEAAPNMTHLSSGGFSVSVPEPATDKYLMGAGAIKDTRSHKNAHHHEEHFEGIQGKELLVGHHSEASPRKEAPEDAVMRDSSKGIEGRNYIDSSLASL